jgi:uncharacterized protein (UPF0276 family)
MTRWPGEGGEAFCAAPPSEASAIRPGESDSSGAGLGIGLMFNPSLLQYLRSDLGSLDYLEIIPDTFWTDFGPTRNRRFVEIEPYVDVLDWTAERVPVVAHHLGLSLGTEDAFDVCYLKQLVQWQQRYRFPWHSDHLSVARVPGSGRLEHAGVGIPVVFDGEMLDLMSTRIAEVQSTISVPLLVENSVYFLAIPEQEYTEPQFLNELTERTGCGLLLDLHNLYANGRNHRFDPLRFLDELDLQRVVEIHIAGGSEFAGMWTDSHSGPCPEPVWQLLDSVLPRTPALRGVTFEFHHSYYPVLGEDGIRSQLGRARSSWNRLRS